MTTLLHGIEDNPPLDAAPCDTARTDTIEARRARRMEALKLIAGMWKTRTDIPADGLEYQRQLRDE